MSTAKWQNIAPFFYARVSSRFEFQFEHPNQSTTLTTDQNSISIFFISPTKIINRATADCKIQNSNFQSHFSINQIFINNMLKTFLVVELFNIMPNLCQLY
jgi:hypothetical protein